MVFCFLHSAVVDVKRSKENLFGKGEVGAKEKDSTKLKERTGLLEFRG